MWLLWLSACFLSVTPHSGTEHTSLVRVDFESREHARRSRASWRGDYSQYISLAVDVFLVPKTAASRRTKHILLMQFHFENMKRKAQQRIKEGRPEPVDPLAVNLFLMPEFDTSVSAPHAIFIGLTLSEVEDVREDIMTWQVGHWYSHSPLDLRTV